MTRENIERFKELFSEYCKGEKAAGRCTTCDCCKINLAYMEIFDNITADMDVGGLTGTVEAQFTSVWDDGAYVFPSKCRVNIETREIVEIETVDSPMLELVNHLDREYVTLSNGMEIPAYTEDEYDRLEPGFYYIS